MLATITDPTTHHAWMALIVPALVVIMAGIPAILFNRNNGE